MWGVGVFAYLVAVFHRSSLAVAGLAAAERRRDLAVNFPDRLADLRRGVPVVAQ